MISASASLQEAFEGYQGHSLFTKVLLDSLKKNSSPSIKDNTIFTIDIANFVEKTVPEISEKVFKKPQYPTIIIHGQSSPIYLMK